MRADKAVYNTFAQFNRPIKSSYKHLFKNRMVFTTRYEELEYIYSSWGRCLSVRSRGKMTSLQIRNIRYGVEQRLFISNPRIIIEYN